MLGSAQVGEALFYVVLGHNVSVTSKEQCHRGMMMLYTVTNLENFSSVMYLHPVT